MRNLSPQLHWLPDRADWRERVRSLPESGAGAFDSAVALANVRLDFAQTSGLDATVRRLFNQRQPDQLATRPVRLAVLGSSTLTHLMPSIRIGALRRGIWVDTFEGDYGQYLQELLDQQSALHAFKPTIILFAFDARHVTRGFDVRQSNDDAAASVENVLEQLRQCWSLAAQLGCSVIQQSILPCLPRVVGQNEQRAPGSQAAAVRTLNARLRSAADAASVDVLDLDTQVAIDGLGAWYDPALWHHAKQEVKPAAGPVYGDLVGRLLAAKQGRSFKCLVLDLDNTLWGGVIGDDGLEGIILGQGSALGEGFSAVQAYAKQLSHRGVILAVCSKNDEANALSPFGGHPEMVLQKSDISAFVANWNDKASNIRAIANQLNIGVDSIVFLDDNPFERDLVRKELPMVAVPEVSDDPSQIPAILEAAGYFETTSLTADDFARAEQYQSNLAREALSSGSTDLASYLRALEMRLVWTPFNDVGIQRVTQLTNKTNQFNLTTRRKSEQDMRGVMEDPNQFGLQLRLIDRFGDNGIIGVVIGVKRDDEEVEIDTWLMSCRVLGRQVEEATLNLVVDQARLLGGTRLLGCYMPTAKNGMVREHYIKLGFEALDIRDDRALYELKLSDFKPRETAIKIEMGADD